MLEPDAAAGAVAARAALNRMSGERIVLAFDFGTRRIGVAIGNTVTRQARPLEIVDAQGPARWRRIGELIEQWRPAQLIVGIARYPDGTAHELTVRCERFARQLTGRYRLPIARVDERYSSAVTVDGRDDDAAAVILQQWLDTDSREVPVLFPSPARGGGRGGDGGSK